jgi:hypothetical protein
MVYRPPVMVSLNPLGELSPLDFTVQATDFQDARRRAHSVLIQMSMNTILTVIFFRNSIRAVRLVNGQWRNVASWCCLVQSMMGTLFGMSALTSAISSYPSCRVNAWIGAFGVTVSSVCTGLFLLVKAYAVQMHDRRLLWLAVPLLLPQGFTVWAAWIESEIRNTVDSGCIVFLPSYYPWVKSTIEIVMNLVFSCIFIKVAFEQYHTFGSRGWRKLGVDNLYYLIFVVLSSIMTASLAIFPDYSMLSKMINLGECK